MLAAINAMFDQELSSLNGPHPSQPGAALSRRLSIWDFGRST